MRRVTALLVASLFLFACSEKSSSDKAVAGTTQYPVSAQYGLHTKAAYCQWYVDNQGMDPNDCDEVYEAYFRVTLQDYYGKPPASTAICDQNASYCIHPGWDKQLERHVYCWGDINCQ